MNRRNFIVSSVMGASALSMFPGSALASNKGISLTTIGKGFNHLLTHVEHISISNLSGSVLNAHQRLVTALDKQGYLYNATEVVKLNSSCFAIPLHKKPILGFNSNELALIVKNNGASKFYILDEKLANEFSELIDNFTQNIKSHDLDLDAAAFAFPTKVIAQTSGRKRTFVYENKAKTKITLCSNKGKTSTAIC